MSMTSALDITIADGKGGFKPGESIAGRCRWSTSGVTSAELRLFWYTQGKGTQDVQIVEAAAFEHPRTEDQRDFRFTLPYEPFSFSGKLISVVWALELILEPGTQVERREIVMAPNGQEIQLPHEGA